MDAFIKNLLSHRESWETPVVPSLPQSLNSDNYLKASVASHELADTVRTLKQLQLIPLDGLDFKAIKHITGIEIESDESPAVIRKKLVPLYEATLADKKNALGVTLIKAGVAAEEASSYCDDLLAQVEQRVQVEHSNHVRSK